VAKYVASPQYPNGVIEIYQLSTSGTLVPGLPGALALSSGYPNDVLIYQGPQSPSVYLFVSVVTQTKDGVSSGNPTDGAVWFYSFSSLDDILTGTFQSRTLIANTYGAVGMVIQPGTGDVYIAASTLSDGGSQSSGDGGIIGFTYASYSSGAPEMFVFTDHNHDASTFAICSNLAFDLHGNLWLTSFNPNAEGDAALVCYPNVGRAGTSHSGADTPYLKIVNGATAFPTTSLFAGGVGPSIGPALPLFGPTGVAFDPFGNLWLASSNQPAITSTLLTIGAPKLDSLLSQLAEKSLPDPAENVPGTGFLYTLTTADILALYAAGNTQFQSLLFDGFNLYLYDQYEAVVWLIAIDPTTAALSEPNPIIISTGQGNGGIAIFDTTPASLLIKDIATDVGAEPDLALAGGHPWESPDIAVTNTPLETPGALPTNVPVGSVGLSLASDGEITGSAGPGGPNSGYVYVRVTNFGATGGASTNGTEVLKVYWAASSAGLNWPTPWDGLETVPGTGTTAMIAGGQIGAAPLGQIDPGNETIFQFEWSNVPDPTQYNGRLCLLARIEASSLYPFGMTFPEETNLANEAALIQNVTDNSKIA